MKKRVLALLLAVSMVSAMTACGSSSSSDSSDSEAESEDEEESDSTKAADADADVTASVDEIKVGMVNPLSGDNALYGLDQQRAMQMAFDEINEAGGIYGAQIVMDCYDDKGDAQEAAKGAQKYADDDEIMGIFGSSLSNSILAMTSIIDDAEVVEMVCSGSSPSLSGCSDYFFRMAAQDVQVGKQIAKNILDNGYTDMVVLYPENDYGNNLSAALVEYAEDNGGNVIDSINYNAADQDFTAILTKVKDEAPEAVALCGTVTDSSLLINQMTQLGIETFIMGGTSLYNSNAVEIAGDNLEGAQCVSVYISTNPDEQVQEFVKKYEEAYDETPDAFAAMGYDMAYTFADACKRAMAANDGDIDRDAIRDALEDVDYDGVTGTVTFNEDHDWVRDYLTLEYTNGEFVLAD